MKDPLRYNRNTNTQKQTPKNETKQAKWSQTRMPCETFLISFS